MARRRHQDWLEGYLEYSQYSEAPDVFHKWTAISTIAGALRRRVSINQGYFSWHPNFFTFFVAPPGIVSKSTTAEIGARLLRQVEGVKFGPSSMTWQGLITAFIDSKEEFLTPTGEYVPMSAITVVASELGTFFDPTNREQVDVLVSLWDGKDGVWDKLTKGSGLEVIENPWINLLGCTTPGWIAENLSNYFIGGGFASRTLFIYADTKRHFQAYPGLEVRNNTRHKAIELSLVEDLRQIASLAGEYVLDKDAVAWGRQWYEDHFSTDNKFRSDPRFGGYFARKQTHIHKTALIRAASLRDELRITVDDLQWAEREVTALEPNMLKVFGEMNRDEVVGMQVALLTRITAETRIAKMQLFRENVNVCSLDVFEAALNAVIAAGLATLTNEFGTVYICSTEKVAKIMANIATDGVEDTAQEAAAD
jgi:hypothetical protein